MYDRSYCDERSNMCELTVVKGQTCVIDLSVMKYQTCVSLLW